MKVGIISNLECYGGVQSCVLALIRGLNASGIRPFVLTDRSVMKGIKTEENVDFIKREISYSISNDARLILDSYLKGAIDIAYFFKTSWLDEEYDFFYIFHPNVIVDSQSSHLYYLSMSPRHVGFSGSIIRPRAKFFVYKWLLKRTRPVYEFATLDRKCVINSNFTEGMFFEAFERHLSVVYPPVPAPAYRYSSDWSKTDVLFFSRITLAKRPELVLVLAEAFPQYFFRIAGSSSDSGYVARLRREINDRRLTNVAIIPDPSPSEVAGLLKAASIYLFPAVNEHFGITTAEAMSYGAIPLVHDSGGQREIVPWAECRFTDDDLLEKFNSLSNKTEAQQQYLRQKVVEYTSRFSEERFLDSLLKYLDLSAESATD